MTDKPSDRVTNNVTQFLFDRLPNSLGSGELRDLTWDGDDDDPYGPLIVKDGEGRRFEIEFEVMVTELTDEEMRRRAEFVERLKVVHARAEAKA